MQYLTEWKMKLNLSLHRWDATIIIRDPIIIISPMLLADCSPVVSMQNMEEGEAFVPKYKALLHATTEDTVEHVAEIGGIDLTEPEFWRKSLEMITAQIDLFIKETDNTQITHK